MTRLLVLVLVSIIGLGGAAWAQAPGTGAGGPDSGAAAFLARNARLPGVTVLPSGLQYKVIQSGPAGPSPKPGDIIKVHYEGALTNGRIFDSTFARDKPALMPLADLVPAWMQALPMMHVGDEWILYVPSELGYGAQGAGPIPPDSALVFRIKLLGMLAAD